LNNLRSKFIKLFNKYGDQKTVLEASSYSYMVYDLIEDLVSEIQAANPSKVKLIAESILKTDKIDDIGRFRDVKKLHAYAGLVPSTKSSGGKTFHGKLVKNCNHILKWALIEAVWPPIQGDAWLKSMYLKKKKHKHYNIVTL